MKKDTSSYTVEREFLNKISIQSLLERIIKSHLNNDDTEYPDRNTKKNL